MCDLEVKNKLTSMYRLLLLTRGFQTRTKKNEHLKASLYYQDNILFVDIKLL